MPTAIIKQPKPIIFFTYTESRHSILVVVYDKKAKSIIYCWNNTVKQMILLYNRKVMILKYG